MKRFFSWLMALVLLCNPALLVVSYAEPSPEIYIDNPVISSPYQSIKYGSLIPDNVTKKTKAASMLPSVFDGRDYGYITDIRNQGKYENCWSHSAMACAEIYAVKNLGKNVNETDYSEMHNAYFSYSDAHDKFGNLNGDSSWLNTSEFNYTSFGGNIYTSTANLAMWQGPVDDEILPQDTKRYTAPIADDDTAYRYDQIHLTDAEWLDMTDRDTVKEMIMEYGAGSTSYYHDEAYYDTVAGKSTYTSYYCDSPVYDNGRVQTNHGITIIGWDDNYSKNNFTGAAKPTADGAWICKNSWGTTLGEHGFTYISYQDVGINDSAIAFYKYKNFSEYDNIYQYDGTTNPLSSLSYPPEVKTPSFANVFTCKEDETQLNAVSFFTLDAGVSYTVRVYTGVQAAGGKIVNPVYKASLKETVSGTVDYEGYHTVKLSKSVSLKKNDKFSVVVSFTNADSSSPVRIPICNTQSISGGVSYVNSGATGRCFTTSISSASTQFASNSWKDTYSSYNADIRVKAFTTQPSKNVDIVYTNSEIADRTDQTIYLYQSGQLKYTAVGSGGVFNISEVEPGNYDIYFNTRFGVLTSQNNGAPKNITVSKTANTFSSNTYVPIGDVDIDGNISVADISQCIIRQNYGSSKAAFDVDSDGSVGISDISVILLSKNYAHSSETV